MARRVVLHIGLMKSGTSFVQNLMTTNRELAAERGVLWPGTRWRDQVAAVNDVTRHGGKGQPELRPGGPWTRLVRDIDAWPGTALVSMEFLGPRGRPKVSQVLESFAGVEVHVVVTARDLARTIPAMWQESIQNGSTTTWDDYVEGVRRERSRTHPSGKNFWDRQAAARIARTWGDVVGLDNVTVVTVPRPGAPPALLWERFASVVPVDPEGFAVEVRSNPSLGLASTLVVRALNERLDRGEMSRLTRQRFVKHALCKRGLALRDVREPRLGLDERWVVRRGDEEIERLRALGVRIVGDLEELRSEPVSGVHPAEVPVDAQLDAALDGLALALDRWARKEGPLDR